MTSRFKISNFYDNLAKSDNSDDESDEYGDEEEEGDDSIVASDSEVENETNITQYISQDNKSDKNKMKEIASKYTSSHESYFTNSFEIAVNEKALFQKFEKYRLPLEPTQNTHFLYLVKCEPGKEFKILITLLKKMFGEEDPRYPTIFSCFTPKSGFGSIYVESISLADVSLFVTNIPGIKPKRPRLVPYKEMTSSITVIRKPDFKTPGSFVTLRRNPHMHETYKGDLGQIIDVNVNENRILIKLLPRLDYDELSKSSTHSQREINKSKGPKYKAPQNEFQRSKILNLGISVQTQDLVLSTGREVKFDSWDGKLFLGSFLYVNLPLKGVEPELHLSQSELTVKFLESSYSDKSKFGLNDLFERNMKIALGLDVISSIREGDVARIKDDQEFGGLIVDVLRIQGITAFIKPKDTTIFDGNLEIELEYLEKYFSPGDKVEIINGTHTSKIGDVINVHNGKATVFLSSIDEPVEVELSYLAHTSKQTKLQTSIGNYKVGDFVLLEGKNPGVIWKIEQFKPFVLTEDGSNKVVDLSQIQRKFNDQKARDSHRNPIKIGMRVNVSSKIGDRAFDGTVVHMSENKVYLKSDSIKEFNGYVVVDSQEISIPNIRQSSNSTNNFISRPQQDRSLLGKTIMILTGPEKGKIADIKEASVSEIKVILQYNAKPLRYSRNQENKDYKMVDNSKNPFDNIFSNNSTTSNNNYQFNSRAQNPSFDNPIYH